MSSFYNVRGFTADTAAEEFDRIAVEEAGVLRISGGGYDCPVPTEKIPQAPEWGTRVINRKGTGNGGRIVLVGLTPRTRELAARGKIRHLISMGVAKEVAVVAASMQYGMERGVALLAVEAVDAVKARGAFSGYSHRMFETWLGRESEYLALTFPRKCAAADIAAKVVQSQK